MLCVPSAGKQGGQDDSSSYLNSNICICSDCMQKTFDAMNNSNFNYSDMTNQMNMQDMFNMPPMMNMFGDDPVLKSQKIKKKKPKDKDEPVLDIKNIPPPHRIKSRSWMIILSDRIMRKR